MESELINRRLLLAKEFYYHAAERSLRTDAINKMMAIHNFHIAVEITLRAIMLKYEIRSEKTLNIDFESMMSEIDKNTPEKLMFRQEMRTLNQIRGLIQHQGIEPDKTSMEEFRVITKRFLEFSYQKYFDIVFVDLSRVNLISNDTLRNILVLSQQLAKAGKLSDSTLRIIAAFKFASHSIASFLPSEGFNSSFFVTSRFRHSELDLTPLIRGFEDTFARIRKSEEFSAILGSGVPLSDLKRLESLPIHLTFSITGAAIAQTSGKTEIKHEEVEWAIDFVVSCILLWQQQGLDPKVNEWDITSANNLLQLDEENQ